MGLLGIDGIGDQLQKTIDEVTKNFVPPGDLVKQVTQGQGTASLQQAHDTGVAQTDEQNQIETDSRQMMANLESAWTGPASENARTQIEPMATSAASASQALHQNSAIVADQVHGFEQLKNSMHTDVNNQPPETSTWDDVTPWDTDTEDQVNARNQKVNQNLEQFNAYTKTSDTNIPQLTTNYGQLGDIPGGDFQIEKTDQPGNPGTGLVNFDEKNSTNGQGNGGSVSPTQGGSDSGPHGGSVTPHAGGSPHGGAPNTPHDPGSPQSPNIAQPQGSSVTPPAAANDHTSAASYTPPTMQQPGSSSYQPPAFGPGAGGSSYQSPALGGISAGGFGPTGGSASSGGSGMGRIGSGAGGGAGGGAGAGGQTPGAGKATGSGMPGESAARGGGAGGAAGSASGGQGRGGGMAGMGGAGRGGGQGGEDDEHQRPSFLVEADPQNIFGSDEKTAPPVIGE